MVIPFCPLTDSAVSCSAVAFLLIVRRSVLESALERKCGGAHILHPSRCGMRYRGHNIARAMRQPNTQSVPFTPGNTCSRRSRRSEAPSDEKLEKASSFASPNRGKDMRRRSQCQWLLTGLGSWCSGDIAALTNPRRTQARLGWVALSPDRTPKGIVSGRLARRSADCR
jgi:hypothetical protein